MIRKFKRIRVSFELLKQILKGNPRPCIVEGLPKEFEIVRVSDVNEIGTNNYTKI